jgi:hypothetical protein
MEFVLDQCVWPDLAEKYDQALREAVEIANEFFTATDLDVRLRLAERLADHTIGARGFFEWETVPELVV